MSDKPQVEFELTASDKTDKGATSAEKRMEKATKRVGQIQRKTQAETEKAATKSGRAIGRTFSEVEKAAAKVFGGRSITSGLTSRLGGITKAASALGDGLGEASAAGTALEGTVGAVGVAVAGTVAVMAAAAYGAFKLADGWAKGAASIGRTAEIIGVNTQKLQEFAAAAERVGVDKSTATSAIGGLSQTLNDARYGRNPQALAAISRLGVGMALNKDGTVNIDAMLPAIASAIASQNSSGRRTAARLLGIPEAALPAFTQGGKALSADMSSAATTAPLITDADVTVGKRMLRRHVMAQQRIERSTITAAGRATAGGLDSVETEAIHLFSGSVTEDFKPGARQIKEAGDALSRAADTMASAAGGGFAAGGRWSQATVGRLARHGQRVRQLFESVGASPMLASALAASAMGESGGDAHKQQKGGPAYGLMQWEHPRQQRFRETMGFDIHRSTARQQAQFVMWELAHKERPAMRRIAADTDEQSMGYDVGYYYERPAKKVRDSVDRGNLAAAILRDGDHIPVKVEVELKGAPPGTRVRVSAGRSKPAISHAIAH